jgi:hypothetical protein
MTDTLLALAALLGVPAALVTLIVVAALTVTRRREHAGRAPTQPSPPSGGAAEPVARHAWTAAHLANARIAQLEARVRQLEAHATRPGGHHR